ncbi:DUF4337 domain-containing protein [Horticoccus sp. 23ND18S-11]|uniref:DUF4337 domain-containing protein n=1 Tax=Horticoccus sp. 23ND18S-11 TaxID=3391832 RepID=UPI0039C95C54
MSGHGSHSHSDKPEHKRIGVFIAIIAVVMAVIGALAKQQANEMIVKEVKASNGFAWYQSKRQRSYANELELKRIEFELAGPATGAQRKILEANKARFLTKNSEYEIENKQILDGAEADRVAAQSAAHRHHFYEYAEIALHIAIVLCSLVLLTEQKVFFRVGIAATLIGIGLAIFAGTSGTPSSASTSASSAEALPAKRP